MPVFFANLSLHLFSVIGGFEWFWIGSHHKNIQLMLEFFKAPFLFQRSLLYINDLPGHVICNSAIYVDDTTPCFKCAQASDLQDTVDWERKWLVDFNAGKTQLVSFGLSNNTGSIDMKMDGSVLEEKSSVKMLGLSSSSKFYWKSHNISIAKTASTKHGDFYSFPEVSFSIVCSVSL